MTQAINQFKQAPVQGELDLSTQGTVISARVSPNQATALIAGQAVKLDTTVTGGLPAFKALAANTDVSFGFVCRNIKDQSFAADARFELAMNGTIMFMTAGAAITRGAKLEVVYTTNKVITNAGTNPVVGFALDAASANNDLIRVFCIPQSYQSAQVIADIAGLQNALDALGSGATQINTALTTVGAGTLLAAAIIGGNITRTGSTAAFTDTTDTAANIVAALPNLTVNESFYFKYYNHTAFQATITGGTGVTVSGQTLVQGESYVEYLATYTALNTFTFVAVDAGSMNNTLYNTINKGAKVCTAQVDRTTSTALTTVTGCSIALLAGATYIVEAHISGTAGASGGAKAAIAGDGTLSATSFTATGKNFNGTTLNALSTTTTLGNAVGAATAVMTDIDISGAIVVNAAGTLNLQIAQNASDAAATSAYANSWLKVTRVA